MANDNAAPAGIAASVFAATEVMAATPYAGELAVGAGVLTGAVGVLACGAVAAYDRAYAAPAIMAGTTWTLAGSWATWTLATGPGVVNTVGGMTATGLVTLACLTARWTRAGDPLKVAKVATEHSKAALNLAKLEKVGTSGGHAVGEEADDEGTAGATWGEIPATVWEPRVGAVVTAAPIDLGGGVVLPLEGGHILIAGCTDAGKSVIMADAIADLLPRPHLRVLVIDPKGDRLLGCLRGTDVRVCGADKEGLAALEECVTTMRRRGALVAERAQAFVRGEIDEPPKVWPASAEEPWDVIVIDEFTDLAGTSMMDAVDEIARKSRSLGQTLIMGTQSVGADLFRTARSATGGGLRAQFSTTVCAHVNTRTESDKLFGGGSAKEGWDGTRLPMHGHVLVQSPRDRVPVMRRVPEMTMPLFADVVRRRANACDPSTVFVPSPREAADDRMDGATEGTQGDRVLSVLADGAWWKAGAITDAAGLPNAAVTRAVLARLRKARTIESDGAGLFRACSPESNVIRGPWGGA
jgi:hypothetical protein